VANDEDAWLEGEPPIIALSVPVANLDKRELCAALQYSPSRLDRLIRLGLPCRKGSSNAAGYRFDLAAVVEWIAEHRAAERAGPEDQSIAAAKRRLALAQARRAEMENARREEELVEADAVTKWANGAYSAARSRLVALESELPFLNQEQAEALRSAVDEVLAGISADAYERARSLESEKTEELQDSLLEVE
jgi:phage terminase Nu1 subunit (DNA packaging protein)